MKALVTGATGFVGSHLVTALVRRGDSVTALVRSPGKAALLNQLNVRQIRGDLDDLPALALATAEQSVIYHVAGALAARSEAEFLRANRDGTANLIAASRAGAPTLEKFVLVSSMAAGGPAPRGRPLQGDEPPHPVTQYGRSKLAGEEIVRASALPWCIVRPPMVYGPRDREVLKAFRLARLGVAPVFGDGSQELSAVFAPDLAESLMAAARSASTLRRTYYACHPERFTSEELLQRVGRTVGRQSVRVIHLPKWLGQGALTLTGAMAHLAGRETILTADKAHEFFQEAWTGDPAPLTRDTGWSAAHDLTAGLAITADWYREAGWL